MTPSNTDLDDKSQRGTWQEWARHVLIELQRLNSKYEELEDKIGVISHSCDIEAGEIRNSVKDEVAKIRSDTLAAITAMRLELQTVISANASAASDSSSNMKVELATLNVKAGIWGLIGAALGAGIPILIAVGLKYFDK